MKNENGTTLPRICFSMALETIFLHFVFRKLRQVYNTSRDFTVSGGASKEFHFPTHLKGLIFF